MLNETRIRDPGFFALSKGFCRIFDREAGTVKECYCKIIIMMTTKTIRLSVATFLAACFSVSVNAATQADVEAGRNEANYRTIAAHCSSKSFAKEFVLSSKKYVRNSFQDHAEVEKIASSRPEGFEEIANWGPSDCAAFDQKLHALVASRAKTDAAADDMMKKFLKKPG